jgi:hypothetical protein
MKRHYTKALALFFLSLALGACSKDTTAPGIDFGADNGYTIRDSRGILTYAADPTDWTNDAMWNRSETGLFSKYNLPLDKSSTLANGWNIITYPNPISEGGRNILLAQFNQLGAAIPAGAGELRMAYAIVDANYTLQAEADVISSRNSFNIALQYDAAKFHANTLYRIYYVMYDDTNKTVYYKGHGDVKVTR